MHLVLSPRKGWIPLGLGSLSPAVETILTDTLADPVPTFMPRRLRSQLILRHKWPHIKLWWVFRSPVSAAVLPLGSIPDLKIPDFSFLHLNLTCNFKGTVPTFLSFVHCNVTFNLYKTVKHNHLWSLFRLYISHCAFSNIRIQNTLILFKLFLICISPYVCSYIGNSKR